MQNRSFIPGMNPFPIQTHQIHEFPSQFPQNNPQLQLLNTHDSLTLDEIRLRDEVIYLHSLWHRGPPPHRSSSSLSHHSPLFLRPSNHTHFKKNHKKSKNWKPYIFSDKEWPVESKPKSPISSGSIWPEFKPNSAPITRPANEEERERLMAVKIHLKGLDSCLGLFGKKTSNDSDDDDDDDDDDDVIDDAKEFEFLMNVFEENAELKSFYEKNCENGEFYCLICGVLGNKLSRKYKNCVALIQHSVTINKTKKKAAHRALGHVICQVLGWDINRLPSLPPPSAVGGANIQSLEKSCQLQNESKVIADGEGGSALGGESVNSGA
ncbi:unnamed protein product [Amaranthus hypochondriacus]